MKQKKYYDRRRRPTLSVLAGDLVVMLRKATKRGLPKKLLPRFVGPFRVVEVLGSNTYKLADLPGGSARKRVEEFKAHSCQLKRWRLPRSLGDDEEPMTEVSNSFVPGEGSSEAGEELNETVISGLGTEVVEVEVSVPVDAAVPTTQEIRRPRRERRLPVFLRENYALGDSMDEDYEER